MTDINILLRGFLGVVILIGCAFLFSQNRAHVKKRMVFSGLFFLIILALLMLRVPFVKTIVEGISAFFIKMVDFSDAGAKFVFGGLVDEIDRFGFIYAFHVLPNIIFFSAVSSLLYYLGILSRIVKCFAWVLTRAYKLSGAECAAAAANVFLGQIAAPIMIKPFLPRMSKEEMFTVMTGGMATMAGAVILGVIGVLSGVDPAMKQQYAIYLLTASILNAPASLLVAHIIMPKTGPVDPSIDISREELGLNAVDAIAQGTTEGVKVALSVGSILIVFTALIGLLNWMLMDGLGALIGVNGWIAEVSGGLYQGLTMQAILGTLFAPVAWIIGVPGEDLMLVGQLLGEKLVLNEFFAYVAMAESMKEGVLTNPHTIMLTTFALCNFANLTSVGVQISGFTALASNQRATVSKYAFLAVIGGNIASLLTTCVAGVLLS